MNDPVSKKTAVLQIRTRINTIDWRLLVFLLLFLNVKLVVKLAAIILIYALRPGFKFGFSRRDTRLPLFYPAIMAIAAIDWMIGGSYFNLNYNLVFLSGLFFWLFCILAIHQVKMAVERNDPAVVHRTIMVFFLINAAFSIAVYLGIIIETGHLNPFRYQGDFQKYFIGTGDYIRGVTMDTSNTNAVMNAFGIIYYLFRRNYRMVLLCTVVMLLTGSNSTNLLLGLVLLYLFIFKTGREQKSMIVVCLLMGVTFLTQVSPQNNKYIKNVYEQIFRDIPREKPVYLNTLRITEKPDSILNEDQKKQKTAQLYLDSLSREGDKSFKPSIVSGTLTPAPVKFIEKPVIPKDSIHTGKFQRRNDTTLIEKKLLTFIDKEHEALTISADKNRPVHIPGKIVAMQQTFNYFKQHPLQLFLGTGIGNFSSKLAFRATGLKIVGSYPERYRYISKLFQTNHLDLYLFYFTNRNELHSLTNSPNSTYDQLISEYGLAGLLCFGILYFGFFLRRLNSNSFAVPLLLMMAGVFLTDYWFEQLSVVVLFELLLLLNTRENIILKHANS